MSRTATGRSRQECRRNGRQECLRYVERPMPAGRRRRSSDGADRSCSLIDRARLSPNCGGPDYANSLRMHPIRGKSGGTPLPLETRGQVICHHCECRSASGHKSLQRRDIQRRDALLQVPNYCRDHHDSQSKGTIVARLHASLRRSKSRPPRNSPQVISDLIPEHHGWDAAVPQRLQACRADQPALSSSR